MEVGGEREREREKREREERERKRDKHYKGASYSIKAILNTYTLRTLAACVYSLVLLSDDHVQGEHYLEKSYS